MLITLLAALSLTSSLSVEVPFLPQTDALCGGAAVAMVFRYWGDAHADIEQFASLVDRRAGGIHDDALVDAARTRGWNAISFEGTLESLAAHLEARRPVIVLLGDRRERYHYVVVTGIRSDGVIVHDPSWGPSRVIGEDAFQRAWSQARYWSLLILPGTPKADAEESLRGRFASDSEQGAVVDAATGSAEPDRCQQLLNAAVTDIQQRGLAEADAILDGVRSACPISAGPLRELAGVRFAQRRWPEAATFARDALALDGHDEYALDLLGSSLFVQDDPVRALRAWNVVGKPRVNLVRIDGIRHSRYQTISEALSLRPNALLTADAFERARRRLDDLPDRSTARLDVRPEADGFATVDVVVAERAALPHGTFGWIGAGARTAIDRKIDVTMPGGTGQGEVWSASWQWWTNRPGVAIGFAAPRVAGLPGVWRVDGSWQRETYTFDRGAETDVVREERTHAGLTVNDWMTGSIRWAAGVGFDAWNHERKTASISASIDRRWLNDRLSTSGGLSTSIGIGAAAGFHSLTARTAWRSSTVPHSWVTRAIVGVERVGNGAPLALWPGAGDGHARVPLLRAHALLADGVIAAGTASVLGRTLGYGTVEMQRWLERPALVKVAIAVFTDAAQASRFASPEHGAMQIDSGAGLRVKVPGAEGLLRIDVAHGVRNGANALTVGWLF
jgi:hypothetical protein